jgi:type I restriction enzyme S subunit
MKRWPTKLLGEIVDLSRERIEPTEHPDTSFNYVGLENIEGHTGRLLPYEPTKGADIKSTKNVFRAGEILYGKLRPYLNKIHLAREDGICSTDIYVLRPRPRHIVPAFAAHYLRSPFVLSMVSSAMAGANLPRIDQDGLLAIPAPLPPLAEQERIVRLLDEADELRKIRIQADLRTADLTPSLFYEMFGDPITNPRRLPVRELGVLCKVSGGGTPSKKVVAYWTGRIPWVSPKDMSGDEVHDSEDHISEQAVSESATNLIAPGSVLIVTRSGILKHTLPVAVNSVRVAINQDIKAFTPTAQCEPTFLAVQLRLLAPKILGVVRVGATVQNIETEVLKRLPVLNPPSQREFAERATEIRKMEANQAASRERLNALFHSMLHSAFQGEV